MKKILVCLLTIMMLLSLGSCKKEESSVSLSNEETQKIQEVVDKKEEVVEETKQEEVAEEVKEETKQETKEEIDSEVLKTYKYWVVFYNPDGTELQREALKWGTIPEFYEGTPYYYDGLHDYEFVGWTNKKGQPKELKPITGNTYFYAKYEIGKVVHHSSGGGGGSNPPGPSTFTVSFNVAGIGTAPADITGLTSGSTITKPAAPTDASNSFCGWYKDPTYSSKWIFVSDTVTMDTTLYAKWHSSATPCSNSWPYLLHITNVIFAPYINSGEYFKYDEATEKYVRQGNYEGGSPGGTGWFHVQNCNSSGYSGSVAGVACTDIDCHDRG